MKAEDQNSINAKVYIYMYVYIYIYIYIYIYHKEHIYRI